MIQVILIDPETKTLTEHTIDGTLESYCALLGCKTPMGYEARWMYGHFMYVDVNGECNNPEHFFFVHGPDCPTIHGKACVVKDMGDGKPGSCTMTLQEVTDIVEFPDENYPEI